MRLLLLMVVVLLLVSFSNVSHSAETCCFNACIEGRYYSSGPGGSLKCVATEYCDAGAACVDGTCTPSAPPDYKARCATCGTCDGLGNCGQPLPCGAPCSSNIISAGICSGKGISDLYCRPLQPGGGTCYCNEMCSSGKCCPDNKCAAATNGCCSNSDCQAGFVCDLTTKTCVASCQADCTLGDGVCHAECNGINGCSLIANCAGQTVGSRVCTDGYNIGVCCTGPVASCGVNTTSCPQPYCSGELLCTYPPSGSCQIPCSGDTCTSCNACTATCTNCLAGQICCSGACKTPACTTNAQCDDSNSCTNDICNNPGTCNAECTHTPITSCVNNDGCCPSGCTSTNDNDCSASCGNGVCETGENCGNCQTDCKCSPGKICCNNNCIPPACSSDADCDDGDASTKDTCLNPGSCDAKCTHTTIALCGNGRCDAEKGENYCSCPQDCGITTCSGDVPGEVCKEYTCSGTSCIQVTKKNCCGNRICEGGEGCWSCSMDCSCPAGQQCLYDKCTSKKLLPNGAECASNEECASGHCEFGYCCAAGLCCRQDSECPRGQVCIDYSCQLPGTKCSDGTPTGQCSPEKPKYCNNGIWVYACQTCGCEEGEICKLDGLCYGLECNDGTPQGKCSSNKPLFCSKNRMLVEKCSECGCLEGFLCDRKGEFCYKKPSLKILSPLENQTVNVGEEKKVVLSGVVVKDEKPVAFTIEGNDSRFLLARYDATSGEFAFENVTPIEEGYNYFCVRVSDAEGNLLAKEERGFRVINAPPGMVDISSLQQLPFGVVQLILLFLFLILLLNIIMPIVEKTLRAPIALPEDSIVLVEGAVGSGKEEFCLEMVRRKVREGKFCVILSYDPAKEENWFSTWERNKLLFIKLEADINEIAISISKMLGGQPRLAFINILSLLLTKYNAEELSDFLSTNFTKLRNANCGAVFCVDKGVNDETLSAIEGLFDGVVEFQVQEEKGKLSSYFRVKEFKTKKFDSNWRRFK